MSPRGCRASSAGSGIGSRSARSFGSPRPTCPLSSRSSRTGPSGHWVTPRPRASWSGSWPGPLRTAGARRAVDLLRREVLGMTFRGMRDGVPSARLGGISVQPSVMRAIDRRVPGSRGTLRRGEAARSGSRARPRSWSAPDRPSGEIVRLEQAGYIRREIPPGGCGGTPRSSGSSPVDRWVKTVSDGKSSNDGPWAVPAAPPAEGSSGLPGAKNRTPSGRS